MNVILSDLRLDEQGVLSRCARKLGRYTREAIANYYISLRSKRFVILAVERESDGIALAKGLAENVAGPSSIQWVPFESHPWWTQRTGSPGASAMMHAQFSYMKMINLLDVARAFESSDVPFFVAIKHMSPAEVECYFEDLPHGLVWRADGSTIHVELPQNVYVTGILDATKWPALASDPKGDPSATIIRLPSEPAQPLAGHGSPVRCPQDTERRGLVRMSNACDAHEAKDRLRSALPAGADPLAPLRQATRLFGQPLPSWVWQNAWIYLANAFDRTGRGLFVEPPLPNLAIAQDFVLAQDLLPVLMRGQLSEAADWDEIQLLLVDFPRAKQLVEQAAWLPSHPLYVEIPHQMNSKTWSVF